MDRTPPDLRFMAALRARREGRGDEARRMLEEILDDDPDQKDALEVLGMMLSESGELDRAIALTRHLASLAPDSVMAHANLSRFYMLKGDKETAEDWQAKARVLGWKEEEGRKAAAGGARTQMEQGVDPAVLARQEKAVGEDPESVVARLALAGSYRKLGMPVKAVAHLREALQRDPGMSVLYLELGRSLEEANQGQEALDVYQRGIPVAERKGDLMPRNQMASRLAGLQKKLGAG